MSIVITASCGEQIRFSRDAITSHSAVVRAACGAADAFAAPEGVTADALKRISALLGDDSTAMEVPGLFVDAAAVQLFRSSKVASGSILVKDDEWIGAAVQVLQAAAALQMHKILAAAATALAAAWRATIKVHDHHVACAVAAAVPTEVRRAFLEGLATLSLDADEAIADDVMNLVEQHSADWVEACCACDALWTVLDGQHGEAAMPVASLDDGDSHTAPRTLLSGFHMDVDDNTHISLLRGRLALRPDTLVRFAPNTGDKEMATVPSKLPGLRRLSLNKCRFITDAGMQAAVAQLGELRSLNLVGCKELTDAGVLAIATSLPQLEELQLQYCSRVSDAGVAHIGAHLAQLQLLDLSGCTKVSSVAPLRGCLHLHVLMLQGCPITDAEMPAVAGLRTLRTLNLGECFGVTDAGVAHLAQHPSLRQLSLHGMTELTPAAVASLHTCPALATLNLSWCTELGDGVVTAVSRMTNLTSLNLHSCGISDEDELEPLSALTALRVLRIGGSRCIGDEGVEAAVKSLKELRTLDLDSCSSVRGGCIGTLSDHPHLTRLNLSGCDMLEDDALEQLATAVPRLRHLKLAECMCISDEGLESISRLRHLVSLDLTENEGQSNDGLLHLARLVSLRFLVVASDCDVEPKQWNAFRAQMALCNVTGGPEDDD